MSETPVTLPPGFSFRNGGRDDRRRLRGGGERLRGGGRDREENLGIVRDEARRDVLQVRLVGLRVLAVDRHVDAFLVAALGERVDDPAVRGVKRLVFDELHDPDGYECLAALRGGVFLAAPREPAHDGGAREGHGDGNQTAASDHMFSSFRSNGSASPFPS